MPLSDADLKDGLENIFSNYPASLDEAAQKLAEVYAGYAIEGIFGPGTIPDLSAQQSAFEGVILPGLQSMSAAGVAGAYASGLAAFWTAVPLTVTGGTGVTIGCPGAAALTAELTAIFLSLPDSAHSAADQIGSALHTATQSVTATITIPPAPPVVTPIA